MKYTVIEYFEDLQDNRYAYHVGDAFPRAGVVVSPKRLEELSTNKNKRKRPLIAAVDAPKEAPTEVAPVEDSKEEKPRRRGKRK